MRLSNPKTRSETGFDHVVHSLNVITPFGAKRIKEIKAFEPGDEKSLLQELDRQDIVLEFITKEPEKAEILLEIFMEMKDNTFTLSRSENSVLSVVELFEIKTMLLQMKSIRELLSSLTVQLPDVFQLNDTTELLDILDPTKERINTFYLYDSFSEKLAALRAQKRGYELEIRRAQKEQSRKIETAYGIKMTPKFEFLVSKSDKAMMEKAKAIPELVLTEEDYMTASFTLKSSEEVYDLRKKTEALNESIEDEELIVREKLSAKVGSYSKQLSDNCMRIGELDFNMAKAYYSVGHRCVKPVITGKHEITIREGRHPLVEEILNKKGRSFCPVSVALSEGVTCITGANMGGKTVSLKMVGLCAMLAQHGFFVPCGEAVIGLSSYIHILIGDSQNVQRGLSSFGSEMEELKDILDQSRDRALLLIDEIASGTNPAEGLALTRSIISYLNKKPYISLITTHYDNVAAEGEIHKLQVRGLADADFDKLAREIRYANRRERIEIIGKYMDYRLGEAEKDGQVPKDALNIAEMLGINSEIIKQAKKYMEDRKDEK